MHVEYHLLPFFLSFNRINSDKPLALALLAVEIVSSERLVSYTFPTCRAIDSLFIVYCLITHTHTAMTVSDTIATIHKEVRDSTVVASSSATAPVTATSMSK